MSELCKLDEKKVMSWKIPPPPLVTPPLLAYLPTGHPTAIVRLKELTWGIKGVGAQGDGSVQLLARGWEEQVEVTRVLKEIGKAQNKWVRRDGIL